jgi:hypothetical protein
MMTIKSASSSLPMAQFDFGQNNVYFGGSNIDSSPMYVKGNEVYLDKDRVKIKIPTLKHPNGVMSFDKMITENNDIKRAMNTMNSAIWQSSSNIEVLGQYILTTTTGTPANTFTHNFEIKLLPFNNIPANTPLYVVLSTSELGVTTILGTAVSQLSSSLSPSSTPTMGAISLAESNNMLKITINTPATSIEKDRQIIITFTLPNATVFTGASIGTKSGNTIARRYVYPDNYPPRLSEDAINRI